jgi:hypothetical protein
MLPGETIVNGLASEVCPECQKRNPAAEPLELRVCQSAAGYYIGTQCKFHGPNSRETGYFGTEKEAEEALDHYIKTGELINERF